jgi:hypothetical protein
VAASGSRETPQSQAADGGSVVVGGGIAPARRRRFAVVTASNDVSEGQMLSRPRRKFGQAAAIAD